MRTILLVLTLSACAALEEQTPALDTAATEAMQAGGCVRIVCALPISESECRVRPGRCHRD